MRVARFVGVAVAASSLLASSCSGDPKETSASTTGPVVAAGQSFPEQRCSANKAAGTITYTSGYDYAAAASIIDVLVAEQRGYFDALCLDVRVEPGLSSANYTAVAADTAQFSSAGSFSELAGQPMASNLVVLAVEGKTAIDTLITKPGAASLLTGLSGKVIGVKGALPPSIRAMLAQAGLVDGQQYTTTTLDGFDPEDHLALDGVIGFAGFKSNEPGQLDRAGVAYETFDPSTTGIPGSFGVIYTSRTFLKEHPMAAVDFMRATMHALADSVADPASASMVAVDFIRNNGNPNQLSPDGEAFRWQTESKMIVDSTPTGQPLGLPDDKGLRDEVDAYAAVGLFGGTAPDISQLFDASVLEMIYDTDNVVIWPAQGPK